MIADFWNMSFMQDQKELIKIKKNVKKSLLAVVYKLGSIKKSEHLNGGHFFIS